VDLLGLVSDATGATDADAAAAVGESARRAADQLRRGVVAYSAVA
jgi:hypothetical protein